MAESLDFPTSLSMSGRPSEDAKLDFPTELKVGTSIFNSDPGSLGYAAQGAGAAFESLGRMGLGMVGAAGGALVGGAKAIGAGSVKKAAEEVRKGMQQGSELLTPEKTLFAPTKNFDEALSKTFEQVSEGFGRGAELTVHTPEWYATHGRRVTDKEAAMLEDRRNISRTAGEYSFDAPATAAPLGVIHGIRQGFVERRAAQLAKAEADAAEAAKNALITPVDTTKYNQQGLDFPTKVTPETFQWATSKIKDPITGEERTIQQYSPMERFADEGVIDPQFEPQGRTPYNIPPEERARLEQEMNMPSIEGQGDLFTEHRAYPEAFPGEARVGPLEPSRRAGEVSFGETPPIDIYPGARWSGKEAESARFNAGKAQENLLQRETDRMGGSVEMSNMGAERFQRGSDMNRSPDMGIPYERPGLSDFGKAGEHLRQSREAFQAERMANESIPYEPVSLKDATSALLDHLAEKTGVKVNFKEGESFHKVLSAFTKALLDSGIKTLKEAAVAAKRELGNFWRVVQPHFQKAWEHAKNIQPGLSIKSVGTDPLTKLSKQITRRGVAYGIKDQIKFWSLDIKRDLATAMKEDHPNMKPEDMKDVAPEGSKLAKRLLQYMEKMKANLLIDQQFSVLSQGKGPISTVIKWVVDNQNHINRQLRVRIEENTRKIMPVWRALRKDHFSELREMLDIANANIGKARLTRDAFKTERQWKVFDSIMQERRDGHARFNSALAKVGRAPIAFIENHLPSIRKGDWWVYIHDKDGKLQHASAYTNKLAANKAYKEFTKDMGKEFDVREPALKKLSEHDLSSFDLYEETMRSLHSGDPIAHAIQRRVAYLKSHMGYARTGIHRKAIAGALGSEAGELGIKNMEHVLEWDIHRRETAIANIDRTLLESQVADLGGKQWRRDQTGKPVGRATIFDNAPIGKKFIDEYLLRAKGKNLDILPLLNNLADDLTTTLGGSHGMVPHGIQNVSSFASLYFLANMRNVLVNSVQFMNNLPKAIDMWGLSDKFPNPAKFMADGFLQMLKPDKIALEGAQWALKTGWLDSAIVAIIEGKLKNAKGEGIKAAGEGARYVLGKVEQHVVRTPSFFAWEKALREDIPDKEQRFQVAANITDNYMVHYDRESSPLAYDKLGPIVGESTRGLKTYSHNAYGRLFEMAQIAKDQGRYKPVVAELMTQLMTTGVKGMIPMTEVALGVLALNFAAGLDWDTPEKMAIKLGDWLTEKGMPRAVENTLNFGAVSTFFHADLSSSMNFPNLPSMLNFVPVQFTTNAIKDLGTWFLHWIHGVNTHQDAMDALLASTPNQAHGWIEYAYSEEGGNIPKRHGKNLEGEFPVPDNLYDQITRFALGFKSLDEAKQLAIVRLFKQQIKSDLSQKMDVLDAIVDTVADGKDIPDFLMEKYVEQGGNTHDLSNIIKKRLLDREKTTDERALSGKKMTPDKMHKLDRWKELMDEELRNNTSKDGRIQPQSSSGEKAEPTTPLTAFQQVEELQNKHGMSRNQAIDYLKKREQDLSMQRRGNDSANQGLTRKQIEAGKLLEQETARYKNRMLDYNQNRFKTQGI